jgi:hypothetical protein
MQHLLLALSIILLTIMAGNGRVASAAGKNNVVIKLDKPKAKKVDIAISNYQPSIYFSRFDMIVN